jgi:hypothetical protein
MVTYVLPIGNIARPRLWISACGEYDDRRSAIETGLRAIVYPPKRTNAAHRLLLTPGLRTQGEHHAWTASYC